MHQHFYKKYVLNNLQAKKVVFVGKRVLVFEPPAEDTSSLMEYKSNNILTIYYGL